MNYRIIYKDELYHHGVKGMKWGVRKDKSSSKNTPRFDENLHLFANEESQKSFERGKKVYSKYKNRTVSHLSLTDVHDMHYYQVRRGIDAAELILGAHVTYRLLS